MKEDAKARPSIELLDLATQQVSRRALLREGLQPAEAGRVLSLSPDEKWLVYAGAAWGHTDIMMIDNFR